VGNASGRSVAKVSFTFEARVKGRSTDIAKYHSRRDDHVIAPNQGYGLCWGVPEFTEAVADPRALTWTLKYKTIEFID
jgi:hypothetical protein